MRSTRSPLIVTVRCLLALDSAVWAVFGAALLTGVGHVGDVAPWIVSLMGALMLANAVALGLSAWLALRGRALVDGAAVVVMVANSVLSLTDEIGFVDLMAFALSVVILVLLILGIRLVRGESIGRQNQSNETSDQPSRGDT